MNIINRLRTLVDHRQIGGLGRSDDSDNQQVLKQAADGSLTVERRTRRRRNAAPGSKILVIDDSKTIQVTLRKMLLQNHYDVYPALDAEKGLEIALREKPDLIFLDIVLPGINGFAALRQLRKDPRTRDIPVIMISGNVQATETYYAERIGADDFMRKPFNRLEVFKRIERLLDEDCVLRRTGFRAKAAI